MHLVPVGSYVEGQTATYLAVEGDIVTIIRKHIDEGSIDILLLCEIEALLLGIRLGAVRVDGRPVTIDAHDPCTT